MTYEDIAIQGLLPGLRRALRFSIAALCLFAILALVGLATLPSWPFAKHLLLAAAAGWLVSGLINASAVCPRCGRGFFVRGSWGPHHISQALGSSCVNCGLGINADIREGAA